LSGSQPVLSSSEVYAELLVDPVLSPERDPPLMESCGSSEYPPERLAPTSVERSPHALRFRWASGFSLAPASVNRQSVHGSSHELTLSFRVLQVPSGHSFRYTTKAAYLPLQLLPRGLFPFGVSPRRTAA
jgi:hypothetical protein